MEENKQCSSYQQIKYHTENERRQNQQLGTINHQTISMKVDLGWITPKNMQHITFGIWILYRFVSSSVTTTKTKDHENTIQDRTIDRYFLNHALRTKDF